MTYPQRLFDLRASRWITALSLGLLLLAGSLNCGGGGGDAGNGGNGGSTPPPPTTVEHQAWFENTAGITYKTQFVGTHGIGGVSVWSLGNDDTSFWTAASAGLPSGGSSVCLGYLPDYAQAAGLASVQAHSTINAVSDFSWSLNASGVISGGATPGLLTYAQAHGIQVYLCVVPLGSDPGSAIFHSIITTNKPTSIANLVNTAKNQGYAGVNIDFEGFNKAYRGEYSSFVHDLAVQLHAQSPSLKLVVSVPAKSSDDPNNDWNGGFDYATLGQDVDLLQMMTYDENGPWGQPGPVAGADWMESCIVFAKGVVAPSKILLGLPAYGYDWQKKSDGTWTKGTGDGSFAWKDIPALLTSTSATPVVDQVSKSSHITYYK